LRRFAKDLLPTPETTNSVRVLERMACFMSQDTHAPFRCATLDFQHLGEFELHESRMGEIEGHRDAGHTVWRKPFVGDPEMWAEAKMLGLQLGIQLLDLFRQESVLETHPKPAHGEIQ
jgi:hypothetical protein